MKKNKIYEYNLETPIEVDGKETSVLNLRRPKAMDFEALDQCAGGHQKQIKMIANCAGLTIEEAMELDGYDYHEVYNTILGFFSQKPSEKTARN